MTDLVLSLFPGIGLLDMAFEQEGFCVVRGPDVLWGGDLHSFHPPPDKFTGIIGGPPCQEFSQLRHIIKAKGQQPRHGNLIPLFESIVGEARPKWFLMENVPDAPIPAVDDRVWPHSPPYHVWSILLNDAAVGGMTSRTRRFSFGLAWGKVGPSPFHPEQLALYSPNPVRAVTGDAREVPIKIGGSGKYKGGGMVPNTGRSLPLSEMLELQGFAPNLLDQSPFTMSAKRQVVGNGVPLAMGRAVAKAVLKARRLYEANV